MDYKKAALALANALCAADQNKRCDLCDKDAWGPEHHAEGCPFDMAYKFLAEHEASQAAESAEVPDLYPEISDEDFRRVARDLHGREGECEVDNEAKVSRSEDGGAYVQAWVWCPVGGEDDDFEDEE